MPRSIRRDPTKPGLAGLTQAHIDARAAGRLTLDDIARDLGVSKQATARAIKKRKASVLPAASFPILPPPTSAAAPLPDGLTGVDYSDPDKIQSAVNGASLALLTVINRDVAQIARDPAGKLGPTAAKAIAQALTLIRSNLVVSQVIPEDKGGDLPRLFVRTMTEAEEGRIQADQEAARTSGELDPLASDPEQEGLGDDPAGIVEPHDIAETVTAEPPKPASAASTVASTIPAEITSAEELRSWLAIAGRTHGARFLRQIAEGLGITVGAGTALGEIIKLVIAAKISASSQAE